MKWTERAVQQGHLDAQSKHAMALFQYRSETSEEYHKYKRSSVAWYDKATQQGHTV